jgi:hypothetical protein
VRSVWPSSTGSRLLCAELYEDEAIAGLISMHPLPEVLDTVLVDRGGAPLHSCSHT